MGFGVMVRKATGALPHRATLVCQDEDHLTGNLARGLSKWTGDKEGRNVRAVKTVSTKFNWTAEAMSWNVAWRQESTIVWFSNLEAKNPRRTY